MDKRVFIKTGLVGLFGMTSVITILTKCFKPNLTNDFSPEHLSLNDDEDAKPVKYFSLDEGITVKLAFTYHTEGGCMYAVFKSILSQLEKYEESYRQFPYHMMKYGSGGISNYGTICGALNGASATIGLLVRNGNHRNKLIEDLFLWYEKSSLPVHQSEITTGTNKIPTSVSNSVLCHASVTNWVKRSGYKANSRERVLRCKGIVADVAVKTVKILNDYYNNVYFTADKSIEPKSSCIQCHSHDKLSNTKGLMNCNSCHTKSLGHKIFGDIHFKIIKEK